ncbi:TPA: hypothetical protein N0F65_009087 [Lagenidium giganteum]|uniref:BTB domain-containing protein n=1 Tax=Lagenidium giganteum TaxID=4803 RepID=A0AAV2YLL3_9STRA|nr:TPA: hypothetical protein N0F65_009087 [Lagenidium giganteum]
MAPSGVARTQRSRSAEPTMHPYHTNGRESAHVRTVASPMDSSAPPSGEEDDDRSETSSETTSSSQSGAKTSSSYANHRDLAARLKRVVRSHGSDVNFDADLVGADVVLCVTPAKQRDGEDGAAVKRFHAHRFMLAASSEPFRAMLTGHMREASEREVDIHDLDPEIVEKMLLYIYTGEVTLSVGDVLRTLLAAEMYELGGLRATCITFVLHNANHVLRGDQIVELPEKVLVEIIEQDELQMREVALLDALVTWGESRGDDGKDMLGRLSELMEHVRFPTMTVGDLYGKVRPLVRAGFIHESLLTEALFYHLKWGNQSGQDSERMRPRALAAALRKRKRVSFIQHVSFVNE